MMKKTLTTSKLLLVLILLLAAKEQIQRSPDVSLTKTDLNKSKYYTKQYKFKKDLKLLKKEILNQLPDTIDYFSFNINQTDKDAIASCSSDISKIKADYISQCKKNHIPYKDEEFAKQWTAGKQGCFIKLQKLYPVIYFQFSNIQKKSAALSSITVNNYYQVQILGNNDNPHLNKESLGKETVVINPKLGSQLIQLSKTHDLTNNSIFDLELTFTTPDYRSDDAPLQLLIDITFNFEEGDKKFYIKTKPFYIDI